MLLSIWYQGVSSPGCLSSRLPQDTSDPTAPRRTLAPLQLQVQVSPLNICAKGIAALGAGKGRAAGANMLQEVQ